MIIFKAPKGAVVFVLCLMLAGCGAKTAPDASPSATDWEPPPTLSAWNLFADGQKQIPADGVIPYDLNSPLFSDYSTKHRFVRVPGGKPVPYKTTDVLKFPEGTVLVKTFAFAHDLRDLSKGERLIETRLLVHRPEGWVALPYLWNAEQTDAKLHVAGKTVDVAWTHTDGQPRTLNYIVPNSNQCKGCHIDNSKNIEPIGPKVDNLNRDFAYSSGTENQLVHWGKAGILAGAPPPKDAPRRAVWNDPASGSLDARARAYLDVNCAHCHRPDAPAGTSGLDLRLAQREPVRFGILKAPVAAGRGAGGFRFDILPGKPHESILIFRLESTDPGVMMPELPRRLVDVEGVALLTQWIAAMPPVEVNVGP